MNTRKFFYGIGLVATGIGIGSVVALLYAPQSGKETRKLISRKAEDSVDYVSSRGREIRRQAGDMIDRGRGLATRLVA
jgi:gas vesicle protein